MMKTFENIICHTKEGVLILSINRVDKLNALNFATLGEIKEVIQKVYDDKSIKGVIITGEGEKAFVAGADIAEIANLNELNARKFAENGQEIFALIENCPKPVIAAVNGFALGGGCELAMACHLRIAVRSAKFGQPEVNLGIIPGYGGTQRLTQLVGKGKALELMMTADMIGAEEAKSIGLANEIAENKEDLLSKSYAMVSKIISKAPLAIGMVIEAVNACFAKDENGYQTEANGFSICCKSNDFKEGTAAFLEKRKAVFAGE